MIQFDEKKIEELTNARNLGFDLKTPCNDCPFRSDAKFHSGIVKDLPRLAENIKEGNVIHSCHKTDPRADGFTSLNNGKIQHCAGMMIMEMKDKGDVTLPMFLYGQLDSENHNLDMEAPVFANINEMVTRYRELTEEKLPRRRTYTEGDLTISIRYARDKDEY